MRTARQFKKFRSHWKNYVFQSLLATGSVFIALMVLSIRREPVIIASIGATAFIIFALPNSITANPRNVIGGHVIGIVCVFLGCLVFSQLQMQASIVNSMVYACVVGASFFIMVVTDTEHPPASATALGIAVSGFSWIIAGTVLVSMIILTAIHVGFKKYLRDLT